MDEININQTLVKEQGININPSENITIDVSQEVVNIDKKVESYSLKLEETPNVVLDLNQTPETVLNFDGVIVNIDANYPQAVEAARIATEKAAEATQIVEGFDEHAQEKIAEYNSNASDKIAEYNQNATEKTNTFNSNATSKTTAYNDNATSKTTAFNDNATSKTTAFNENASEKQALVDASAQAASQSAAEAKQWAIGDPSEPTGNSAKYWAEQSAGALSGLTTRVSTIEGKIPSAASSSNKLADKSYVDTADNGLQITINSKQNTLVSGTNIKTINNNSILGSGNLDINGLPTQTGQSGKFLTTDGTDASWADVDALPSQTGQSGKYLTTDGSSASWATLSINPDNKSITTNSSDELQAVGVINSRDTSTAVKTWTGTKAQYDAIVTKDPNTLYNITDDTTSCTDIYSKTEVDSLLDTKANVNLSNMNPTQTVKNTIVGWGMPDYSQVTTISFPYTCLTDGFITHSSQNSGAQNLYINGNLVWNKESTQGTFGYSFCLPVSKDDVITASGLNSTGVTRFIPLKGVN